MNLDAERLRQALDCAATAIGVSDPNPRVGCVLGREDGTVIAVGATQAAGGPHAEVMALRAARAEGKDTRGLTAWVTLEPCAHHGRTPPCCEALIASGVSRVVVALEDPFPLVAGAGIARLRSAGVRVDMAKDEWRAAALELNIGFFSRMIRGRPWVRLKAACSLDGRIALPDGRSQWITGPTARADGHVWRKRAGAVLTGIGTVLADDPRLDVRLIPTKLQPLRVVVDSQLQISQRAHIIRPPGAVLIATCAESGPPWNALTDDHVSLLRLCGEAGRVDLNALVTELGRRQINEVHVEAGPRLNAALLQAGLVDELLIYQAPKLIGVGMPVAMLGVLGQLSDAAEFRFHEATLCGEDLRIRARPIPRVQEQHRAVEAAWMVFCRPNHPEQGF